MFQKKQTNECPSKFSDPAQNAVKHLKSIACFHILAVYPGFIFLAPEVENRLYGFAVHEVGQNWEDDRMVENLITKPDSQLQLLIV